MKKRMYDFLVWCSGSNPDILNRSPRSEQIKHSGYGALVLIPAMLAVFAMTYALSTFTNHWYVYVPAGICWAVIIFFADRFLVSSFRKANNFRIPGRTARQLMLLNLKHDVFSFALFSRLLLSAFIGVGVAHPLVLLYFHKDIEQIMAGNKMQTERTIRADHDTKAQELNVAIAAQEDYVKCLRKLLIYEQSDVKISTDCGSTSGIPGYKKRAETINGQLAQAQVELNNLYNRDNLNKATQENLKQLELEKFRNSYSNGYIARENALVRLEEMAGSNARTIKYFLIIFLVIIDTLAIAWKALARRGPYDDHLHVVEDDISVETQLQLMKNEQTIKTKAEELGFI